MAVPETPAQRGVGGLDPQLRKTLILAGLAILAAGLLAVVIQRTQFQRFWKEVNDFRTESRYGEFLDWLREHPEAGQP